MSNIARERDYSTPQPCGTGDIEYPFRLKDDYDSYLLPRFFKQTPEAFKADKEARKFRIGTVVDPDDGLAWLVAESNPQSTLTGLYAFSRTFARVPPPQLFTTSRVFTKPNPESVIGVSTTAFSWFAGGLYDVGIVTGFTVPYNGAVFARNNKVHSRTGIATPTLTTPSGGTFILEYNGSSTAALPYNETDGNIAAAINALASVIAEGLTFTASNLFASPGACHLNLTATVGTPGHRFTIASSITPGGASTVIVLQISATVFSLQVGARATLTGHGFSAVNCLYLERSGLSSASGLEPGFWVVVDANTIAFPGTAIAYLNVDFIGQSIRNYTPGSANVRIRDTQNFYLPGVTPGIATVDDIPIPVANTSDLALLDLASGTATGYQTYDVTRLVPWRETAIQEHTITEINVDNL